MEDQNCRKRFVAKAWQGPIVIFTARGIGPIRLAFSFIHRVHPYPSMRVYFKQWYNTDWAISKQRKKQNFETKTATTLINTLVTFIKPIRESKRKYSIILNWTSYTTASWKENVAVQASTAAAATALFVVLVLCCHRWKSIRCVAISIACA